MITFAPYNKNVDGFGRLQPLKKMLKKAHLRLFIRANPTIYSSDTFKKLFDCLLCSLI